MTHFGFLLNAFIIFHFILPSAVYGEKSVITLTPKCNASFPVCFQDSLFLDFRSLIMMCLDSFAQYLPFLRFAEVLRSLSPFFKKSNLGNFLAIISLIFIYLLFSSHTQ
jgi:hypothetical protein